MDSNVPVEETVGALKELVEEGRIGAVGLSEVGESSIRRAQAVCPINVVEIEFSLWSTEMLTNGIAAACKELDIPILTYSPLGYGFLTGQVKTLNDIPKGDIRHMFGRFQPQVQGSHSSPFRLNRDFCILITSLLRISPRISSWLTKSMSLPNIEVSRLHSWLWHRSARTPTGHCSLPRGGK